MNKSLLQCPKCKKTGGIDMWPWQGGPGVFGAVSILCDYCEGFFILKLNNAKELILVDENIPQLPNK